ncbi:hypothetical protein AAEX28_00245 [Lentisphaerota bacterium WC36G]|nr:PDZ domain-containing protein [Lentisphaerae bacterium WC36]
MKHLTTALLATLSLGYGLSANNLNAAETKEQTQKNISITSIGKDLLKNVKSSLVKVQYFVKYDKGVAPETNGYLCGGCGSWHSSYATSNIEEDRPVESPGYLIANDKVIAADMLIHPRFIKEIKIEQNGEIVTAKISSYYIKQNAVELTLEKKLSKAKPLNFVSKDKISKKLFNVSYSEDDGFWNVKISPFSRGSLLYRFENDSMFYSCMGNSMVIDEKSNVLAFTTFPLISIDESWKVSPLKWPQYTQKEMSSLLEKTKQAVNNGIFTIKLKFRSPKTKKNDYYSDEEINTEHFAKGILLENKQILVLASLKPADTARLEGIEVIPQDGKTFKAKFAATLKDFNALVADVVTKDIPYKGIKFAKKLAPIMQLLPTADLKIVGDKITPYYHHNRVRGFETGWKNQLLLDVSLNYDNMFVFDDNGTLLAFPIGKRTIETSRYSYDDDVELYQSMYFTPIFKDLAAHIDKSNIPLSAEEENRIGFFGVELQPLSKDLADLHKISELTEEGEYGALVSYVYKNSTAEKLGISAGDILIDIKSKESQVPVKIEVSNYRSRAFPWNRLDEVPEMYFDRIPTPWQSLDNSLNGLLTKFGIGKEVIINVFKDGKRTDMEFKVQKAPTRYDNAKKFKSEKLGCTVKNITFELRRYFQMKDSDPGVIISKIIPGSKVSTSGIKPFEIITHINDEEVKNIDDFKRLSSVDGDLRFSVKRMAKSRIVKINNAAKEAKKAKKTEETKTTVKAEAKQ